MDKVQPNNEVHPEETNADYHADTSHVGHSMKEVFLLSRRVYHGRYVTGELPSREETAAMLLGSAAHCLAGEPELFRHRYAVAPQCDRRTKDGKAIWADFVERSSGKSLLTADQMAAAEGMAAAVRSSSVAPMLWTCEGLHEHTIRWTDADHALPRKCRCDKLIDSSLIVDLKTADDPTPAAFARKAANLGYYRQAAWYLDGLESLTGVRGDFVFLVVGASPPHEVFAYEPDPDDLERADKQNRRAIEELAECYRTGVWLTPGADAITRLSLPKWTHYSDAYSLED